MYCSNIDYDLQKRYRTDSLLLQLHNFTPQFSIVIPPSKPLMTFSIHSLSNNHFYMLWKTCMLITERSALPIEFYKFYVFGMLDIY